MPYDVPMEYGRATVPQSFYFPRTGMLGKGGEVREGQEREGQVKEAVVWKGIERRGGDDPGPGTGNGNGNGTGTRAGGLADGGILPGLSRRLLCRRTMGAPQCLS